MAANSAKKQRGRPFRKGESGNPAGKTPGAQNRKTLAVQELLNGEAEKLTRRCVELALEERLAPPPKDRHIDFPIPAATTGREINMALTKMAEGVSPGTLTPGEGKQPGRPARSPPLSRLVTERNNIYKQVDGTYDSLTSSPWVKDLRKAARWTSIISSLYAALHLRLTIHFQSGRAPARTYYWRSPVNP